MCTWLYRRLSCQYVVELEISGSVFWLLPEPEAFALHHDCQHGDGVVGAGHRDQGPSDLHLLHKVPGSCCEHVLS